MTTKATVVLDSLNSQGVRLTTFVLEYPAIIHSHVLTHRAFSRCTSSARAISTQRMIGSVVEDPFIPEVLKMEKRGMSGGDFLDNEKADNARTLIRNHMISAIELSKRLSDLGVHKQWANRYLYPFSHVRVVLSATEYENFFNLRVADDAQDETQKLAKAMKEAIEASHPKRRNSHIPFLRQDEASLPRRDASAIAAARAARGSYTLSGMPKETESKADVELYERLIANGHMSPLEHVAFDSGDNEFYANYRGWIQLRHVYRDIDEWELNK